MEDMERYGDYNDIEEDAPKSQNIVLLILKIITAVIIIGVVGIIAFRLILFNNYPDSQKKLYFDDVLTEYYNETDGDLGAKTQSLRFPYDDPDLGNFFCDHLIVIEGAKQIQISVRYNQSTVKRLNENNKGLNLSDSDPDVFTYRLTDNYGRVYSEVVLGDYDTQVMYRYQKLVFNGVELTPDKDGKFPEYLRLEIFVPMLDSNKPYAMIPIYENNVDNNKFTDYTPSSTEVPSV